MQELALLGVVATVFACAVAMMAVPASGAAVVTRQTITSPISEAGITDPFCPARPGRLQGRPS
jgi:hypothetical protein